MKLSIGCDHAGFEYKEALRDFVKGLGHEVIDVGTFSVERADYPDFGVAAARLVSNGTVDFGIVICGSGIGITIAANKVSGIRAANCVTVEMAQLSRAHNNANVVGIGERLVSLELAKEIIATFLATEFEGGRHTQRVEKIHQLGDIT